MLRSGAWHRVRHGAYTEGSAWRSLDEQQRHTLAVRAVVRQSATSVVVSHTSALPLLGAPTWGLSLDLAHVTRTDGRAGRREAGVRQHRGRILDGDVTQVGDLPVMAPTRVALEVSTLASSEASLVVVNHLLHAGATTVDALRARYELGIDRWAHTLSTDLVLRRADGRCESVGESRFWHFCHTSGLPLPVPQYVVREADGSQVARLDFAWPDLGVFVEFDGLIKYAPGAAGGGDVSEIVLREKQREDAVRELTGWICIRVTWQDLANPRELERRLRRAFAVARRRAIA